jgi:PEP-CTERM motif
MKKLTILIFAFVVLASIAGATPIFCGSASYAAGNAGPVSITCAAALATAPGGSFINSITLIISSDYTGFINGNPSVTLTYTQSPLTLTPDPLIPDPLTEVVNTNLGNTPPNSQPVTYTQTVFGNFGLSNVAFTILGTSAVAGGGVVSSSSVIFLDYTTSPIIGGVPEPATMGLMGASLLGLGFLARKSGKKK